LSDNSGINEKFLSLNTAEKRQKHVRN